MSDMEIEKEIQAKGLTAPRLTLEKIKAKIKLVGFIRVPNTTMTICTLLLQNGTVVTGESAAASPENFDEEIVQKIAYEKAVSKIWELEGYLLRERLANGDKAEFSEPTILPDGSAFPLPKDHWIYQTDSNGFCLPPPMPLRMPLGAKRYEIAEMIREATKYAVRASTRSGRDMDFDPDAMCRNMIVGLIGYYTSDGLDPEGDNPKLVPKAWSGPGEPFEKLDDDGQTEVRMTGPNHDDPLPFE